MDSKRRIPLLAVLVAAFGLMGGAIAQADEGGPGGGGGGGGGTPLDPVICTLTGGGEACSEEPGQPSEPGPGQPEQPGEPGEPEQPGQPPGGPPGQEPSGSSSQPSALT